MSNNTSRSLWSTQHIISIINWPIVILSSIAVFLIILFWSSIVNNLETWTIELATWAYPNNEDCIGLILEFYLKILGGIALGVGLIIAYRRAKAMEQNVEKQSETIELTRISQQNERFKNAVEHLGDVSEPIVLGGVEELHQLAKNDPKNYANIVSKIYCGFIRSNHELLDTSEQVVITILEYLLVEQPDSFNPYLNQKKNLQSFDFRKYKLENIRAENVNFSNSLFSEIVNAQFKNCRFDKCYFTDGKIENVTFSGGFLSNNHFLKSSLKNVHFKIENPYDNNFYQTPIKKSTFPRLNDSMFVLCNIDQIEQSERLRHIRFYGGSISDGSLNYPGIQTCKFVNCQIKADVKREVFRHNNMYGFNYSTIDGEEITPEIKSSIVELGAQATDEKLLASVAKAQKKFKDMYESLTNKEPSPIKFNTKK